MKRSLAGGAAAVALMFALAGCAGGSAGSGAYGGQATTPAAAPSAPAAAASGAVLGVSESSLGQIVVDAKGMTVYMFDKDTQGATSSVCSGQCATSWPAVDVDSANVQVDGVTGKLGTITGVDGKTQLTLNGWPLYYYAGDSAAGDVTGQGVGNVWWVLSPTGERMAG